MLRRLYSLLLYLLLPLALVYFLWRGLREPEYLRGWGQRLGFFAKLPSAGFWVHAASVGEVQMALGLIKALHARYPQMSLLLTTFTPTGRAHAQAALPADVKVVYVPLDLPHATRLFLRRACPRLAIIIETELWPNLLHGCGLNRIPVLLVNASISQASLSKYQRWPLSSLIKPALRNIDLVSAASADDAEAFRRLGVPVTHVLNTGNLKFDFELPANVSTDGQALRQQWQAQERPVWIAASTHAGEEAIVLEALKILLQQYPDALLILAPRHPQRFAKLAVQCKQNGFVTALRSQRDRVDAHTQILFADSLGELSLLYAAADVAFVGGSLVAGIGGHNLLEPAALSMPIIVGMYLGAWAQVADLLRAGGALSSVVDAQALAGAVAAHIDNAGRRKLAGAAAVRVVQQHGGALECTLRLVPELLIPG